MLVDFELSVISKHWEIAIEVGNDWGSPSYTETRRYNSKEEALKALKYRDYYDTVLSIKEVVEYERVDIEDEE